jgi:hypothetical protein
MNAMSDWFSNNWIDLARLLVQLAIFAAVVRYGSKLLATLRASQEQIGALLKLSVSETAAAVQPAPTPEPEMTPEPSKRFGASSAKIWEPEPEPRRQRERDPEREPEPVFAGGYSRPSYAAEPDSRPNYAAVRDSRPNYAAVREQSLGGRLTGAPQAPAFAPPGFTPPTQRVESAPLTPWVSSPAMEPERLNIPAAPLAARPSASSWLQPPMRSNSANPWRKMVRWLQAPVRR